VRELCMNQLRQIVRFCRRPPAHIYTSLVICCLRIFDHFLIFLIVFGGRLIERHDDLVCLVRIDAIGDYILFRQTLRSLRFSPRLAGKRIVLCGNAAWQTLAEYLDADCFEEFIPVDHHRFNARPLYRAKTLLRVRRLGAAMALHPTFSREYPADVLIAATGAREKIGFRSIPQNITTTLKRITDKFYTELVENQETYPFELRRNQEFLRHLGVPQRDIQPFQLVRTPCLADSAQANSHIYRDRPIFFIGASAPHNRWPAVCWLELALRLAREHGLPAVWLGGRDCEADMRKIATRLPAGTCNLVGKTSLIDLLHIIADAQLVVTNDSMALHFAAMLAIPHLVISSGQHLGRFHPYPADMAPRGFAVYPEEIGSIETGQIKRYYYAQHPFPMASISVERVYAALTRILKQQIAPVNG